MPAIKAEEICHECIKPGVLSVAINLGNPVLARQDAHGELQGLSVGLAKKLASALGWSLEMHVYSTAGKVVEDSTRRCWDIAFLAIDPKRAQQLSFTRPYITIEGTYLVAESSPWQNVDQLDQAAITINVGKGAAYDLFLTRHLNHASLNRLETSQSAIERFLAGEGDVVAGVRQPLQQAASVHAGYRVLADSFTEIQQAICTPRGNERLFAFISGQITEWLDSGEVARMKAAEENPAF